MKAQTGDVLTEGHAMWVELFILESQGIAGDYIEHERARMDVYGRGYWEIDRLLQEKEMTDPFALLFKQFPRN